MIEDITIIGGNLTTRGWAIAFARTGFDVRLHVPEPEASGAMMDEIGRTLADLAAFDGLNGAEPSTVAGRIRVVPDLAEAVRDAVHIQDNTDGLAAKSALFRRLDALAPTRATIGSSNVGILPSRFAEALGARDRVLLVHPINPALIPVVEVAPTPWTAPAVVEGTVALMRRLGLRPVVLREFKGLVIDRLAAALIHECFRLVAGGFATVEQIDACVSDGLARRWAIAGPFETMDVNASGGIADYIRSSEELFREVFDESQSFAVPWSGELGRRVEAQCRECLAPGRIDARAAWRNRELARLRQYKSLEPSR